MNIGIYGYGNLGRGVEDAVKRNPDMNLVAVFTRRSPESLTIATEGVPVVSTKDIMEWKDKIDVLIICGGSATDLPEMTPALAESFNVIDSFDNHQLRALYRRICKLLYHTRKNSIVDLSVVVQNSGDSLDGIRVVRRAMPEHL